MLGVLDIISCDLAVQGVIKKHDITHLEIVSLLVVAKYGSCSLHTACALLGRGQVDQFYKIFYKLRSLGYLKSVKGKYNAKRVYHLTVLGRQVVSELSTELLIAGNRSL